MIGQLSQTIRPTQLSDLETDAADIQFDSGAIRMNNRALATFIVAAFIAGTHVSEAQTAQPNGDSVITELVHADSSSKLTLTNRDVVFEYTPLGVERARRRTDSTTAGYTDRAMAALVRASVNGAFQGIRIPFKIDDVANAEALGRTVLIRFKSTQPDSNNLRQKSFDFDAVDEGAAQAFVVRLNHAVAQRRG
jgi:hypothetical protein